MTDCTDRVEAMTFVADEILRDDLAGLAGMNDRRRIERYNDIEEDLHELRWEFPRECPDTLTDGEADQLRSRLRLAQLMIVASFHRDGDVPESLSEEFAEAALDAAVDFERYKQFDALSEDQINRRIRRMEGEVYELVTEYTDTQLANMDELLESADVRQDVMERLSDRYEDRLEKIREGFYTYVEERGLSGTVEAIEDAITSVSESQQTRENVEQQIAAEIESVTEELESGFRRQRAALDNRLRELEGEVADAGTDPETIRREIERLEIDDASDEREELTAAIETVRSQASKIGTKIDELEEARDESADADSGVAEEVAGVVDGELERLRTQRSEVREEVERLREERERVEAANSELDDRRERLTERVEEIETAVGDGSEGIDGEGVVTPTVARLLELDYVGRFETAVHEAPTIRTADGSFDVPEGYWGERSGRRNDRPRLARHLDDDQDPERFPVNRTARFEITDSRLLGLRSEPEMVVEATVLSDLEAHATAGFDAAPASLDDLLSHVNRTVHEAESEEIDFLLGIASPTGWADAVRDRIVDGNVSRTRFSRRVSVVLVDLRDGSLIYDDSDPVAAENARLFELPVDDERVRDCVAAVERRFDGGPTQDQVSLAGVAADAGFDSHVVKRAFDHLAGRGYAQEYVDDELFLVSD